MIWTADDIRELTRVLQNTDAVVIADEVYEHILFDGARHESLARYPEIADARRRDQFVREDVHDDRMEGRLLRRARGADGGDSGRAPVDHLRGEHADPDGVRRGRAPRS